MAEQNPIKYSDLIVPDDSIEKLIRQLTEVNELYKGLANDIKTSAAAIQQSMKAVSGATEQGRAATKGAAQDADRLAKAQQDLAYAQGETAKQIAQLKAQQKEQNWLNKLNAQLATSTAGSYNALSAQYSLNKIALNKLSAEERATLPNAKALEEETKRIYEEMKRLQEATGKYSLNVGNYENAINNVIGVQSQWFKSLQDLGALFQGGLRQGIMNAGTAVGSFGKQLLALLANPIVATIAAITAAFVALAKGISSSEENTNTLMRILAPFERILTGVVNVLQTMAGWLLKAVEGFENLAMGASRLMERLPLVGGAFKKVNDALQENINLTLRKQQLDKAERENTVTQATLARNVAKWRRDAEMSNDPKRRLQLLKMANAAEERMMYNEIGLAKEALAIAEAKAAQSQNDKKTNEELAQARARLMRAEENYYQRTTRLQSKMRNIANGADKGSGSKGTSEKDKAEKEAKELERIRKQKDQRELTAMRQAEDAKVALMENEYDRQRAQAILNYDRQIEDTKTKMSELGDDEVETKKYYDDLLVSLEQQKWNRLAEIADKEMKAAVDAERRDYEERIKATDKLVKDQQKKKKEKKDIYDLLGFKLDDEEKQAINTSVQFAIESVNQFMAAYVQAAEEKRRLADQAVSEAQMVLMAEIEARNQGYASEVETARKELDNAKKNQQAAIKEQRKAQKAQEAIQTAQQIGNLVTASSLIWSQLGFPWAIPALAVMWASFAASKVMAVSAAGTGGSEEYGEGTVELLEGGSHQSGNDIDLGRKKDGTRRRAEGGEFFAVINKRNSRKYRDVIPDVINSLNAGTFADKYMSAYEGGAMDVVVQNGDNRRLDDLSSDVRRIREQGETRTYNENGYTVIEYKNVKRKIKAS